METVTTGYRPTEEELNQMRAEVAAEEAREATAVDPAEDERLAEEMAAYHLRFNALGFAV